MLTNREWIIENPNTPFSTLCPPSPLICLEYNPKDPTSLISGMLSGQVAAWDTRVEKDPVAISEREFCHRDYVNSVSWINSKSGTEFFSGSSDGQAIWYLLTDYLAMRTKLKCFKRNKIKWPLGYALEVWHIFTELPCINMHRLLK